MKLNSLNNLVSNFEKGVEGVHGSLEYYRYSLPPYVPHLCTFKLGKVFSSEEDFSSNYLAASGKNFQNGEGNCCFAASRFSG